MNTLIKYWSYLVENEDKEISFESYILSEDKKTYIQKHQNEEDFDKDVLDKYWNEIRSRIKGKPEADIDQFWMNKPFKDLALFVNNFDTRNQKERKTDKNKEAAIEAGAHYLGDMKAENGLTYEIWIPTSHKSANILRNIYKGGNDIGTAWCITVAGNDNFWNDYVNTGNNNFIFLINKDPILSKTDYRIDDKVAVQIKPNDDITLWDMNDDAETLYKNNFKSIIDFAIKKSEEDKLFPNKYEKITIGGKTIKTIRPNINCVNKNLTTLEGSPEKVDGSFNCSHNNLTSLEGSPREVNGNFDCFENQLTSLEGAPKEVGGHFDCSDNKLTSLEGSPEYVKGCFDCFHNELISLKGAPQEIGGYFDCSENRLTSLEGVPEKVYGSFNCSDNKLTSLKGAPQEIDGFFKCDRNELTSLEGAPQEVSGYFSCARNNLTSLEGVPEKVSGDFDCKYNQLTSLKGAPRKVHTRFNCSHNNLTSLEGAPQEVGEDFNCSENKLTSLEGAPQKVSKKIYFDKNPDLPQYKVDAYRAYLRLSDSQKAPLTKDNHYYPTEEWENKFK